MKETPKDFKKRKDMIKLGFWKKHAGFYMSNRGRVGRLLGYCK